MRKIRIQNPSLDKTYKTFIATDYASGTSMVVLNNVSFAANDLLVIGEPREELTEQKKLNSISGSTGLTLASTLNFAHQKSTAIYKVLWDQVSIEANYGSGFSVITSSAIQWDSKTNETIYFDQNGTDSTTYRFRFYNSVTATYSDYSPTMAGSGFTRSMVGYMIREVRKIVNDVERKIVQDDEIIRFFNRAQDVVYSHNTRYWFLKVDTYKQATGIAIIGGTDVYSLATYTDFGFLDIIRFLYSSGGVRRLYPLIKKAEIEFDALTTDLNRGHDDWAGRYKLLPADSSSANGYIQIDPIPLNSGVATMYPKYYKKMTNLANVTDTTPIPLPDILEDFAISMIERIKGNETKATQYMDLFLGPPDDEGGIKDITGLKLLDQLDEGQKQAGGQPRNLVSFKGRRFPGNMYGNPRLNRDTIKELYMD